ncbi:sulfotransferase domain-containing protein [Fulvivirga sp.]|uniref:sulfotransferase domain-containing protein n=1 Tax=Fulvivirga sp. TaxID=1931237 RepID=UPI0032EE64DE
MNNKIDIIIGGFQKCATTSFQNYLGHHSKIITHPQIEMTYFYNNEEYSKGWDNVRADYFDQNENAFYLAKHAALLRSETAIQRLYYHNPNVKVILILRNPIERAWSSFLMELRNKETPENFETTVNKLKIPGKIDIDDWRQNVYIGNSIYPKYINSLFKVIPEENVKLLVLEEFENDRMTVLKELFMWLGLDNELNQEVVENRHNQLKSVRNEWLNKPITWILKEGSIQKKTLQKVLSPKVRNQLGAKLRNVNTKKVERPELKQHLYERLQWFFEPIISETEQILKREIASWK